MILRRLFAYNRPGKQHHQRWYRPKNVGNNANYLAKFEWQIFRIWKRDCLRSDFSKDQEQRCHDYKVNNERECGIHSAACNYLDQDDGTDWGSSDVHEKICQQDSGKCFPRFPFQAIECVSPFSLFVDEGLNTETRQGENCCFYTWKKGTQNQQYYY